MATAGMKSRHMVTPELFLTIIMTSCCHTRGSICSINFRNFRNLQELLAVENRKALLFRSAGQEKVTTRTLLQKKVLVTSQARLRRKSHFPPFLLHQHNDLAHTALSVKLFLDQKRITVYDHSSYSPDPAPCDFFSLSLKPSSALKGTSSLFQK